MTHDPRHRPGTRRRIVRPPDRGDAGRLAEAIARWYVEVLSGRRPLDGIGPLLTPAVAARVDDRRRALARARHESRRRGRPVPGAGAAEVVRVAVQWPAPHVAEALVLVRAPTQAGPRTTAVSATLQVTEEGWRVTDLAAPEDGVEALRPPALPPTARPRPTREPHARPGDH
ncbi:MAG: Rv3235 family protein [Actinomycetes bacterium]